MGPLITLQAGKLVKGPRIIQAAASSKVRVAGTIAAGIVASDKRLTPGLCHLPPNIAARLGIFKVYV